MVAIATLEGHEIDDLFGLVVSSKQWISIMAVFLTIAHYVITQSHISWKLLDNGCQIVAKNIGVNQQVGAIVLNEDAFFGPFSKYLFTEE